MPFMIMLISTCERCTRSPLTCSAASDRHSNMTLRAIASDFIRTATSCTSPPTDTGANSSCRRLSSLRRLSMTSAARLSSRRMSARIWRISWRSGSGRCNINSPASALSRIAPSGWLNSCTSDDDNVPSTDTRPACASSRRSSSISSRDRSCSVTSRSTPWNDITPLGVSISARPRAAIQCVEPSGGMTRNCTSTSSQLAAPSRHTFSTRSTSSGCMRERTSSTSTQPLVLNPNIPSAGLVIQKRLRRDSQAHSPSPAAEAAMSSRASLSRSSRASRDARSVSRLSSKVIAPSMIR